jgi:tetratricopeptide (TPR) repeat protein
MSAARRLAVLLAAAALPAQAPVQPLDGRPLLLCTLRAGDKVYTCHLLVDLAARTPLILHSNAAGTLRAPAIDVEAGELRLTDVPVQARRDRWLEYLTARYAQEIQEVPVAGILGLDAFGDRTIQLDGPGRKLRLLPPGQGFPDEAMDPAPEAATVPVQDDRGIPKLEVTLGGKRARLTLHTRDPFNWLDPALAAAAGHPDGLLPSLPLGRLDLAAIAPFRPLASEAGHDGGIGARTLAQMVVTLGGGRVRLERTAAQPYPELEAAFYRARHGATPIRSLRELVATGGGETIHEAAHALIDLALGAEPVDRDALRDGAFAAMRSAPADARGREALALLEKLPADAAAGDLRAELAGAALDDARKDVDGTAVHRLRIELGRLHRQRGELDQARRHLLAAVFGDPVNGHAQLELGEVHFARQEHERALARFFLATLDARQTGQQGLLRFLATHPRVHGDAADPLATLLDLADGRVPALHPIPREPETIRPTGRVALVELFTGAMCPPCVAADAAVDAIAEHWRRDEVVVLQWHLPIPAPEPLVAPVAEARAQRYGVRGTPTVVFNGRSRISGGGKADAAPEMFARYEKELAPLLQAPPRVALASSAELVDPRRVRARITTDAAGGQRLHVLLVEERIVFPGSNGMLFHGNVVRAALTPGDGRAPQPECELELDLDEVAAELDRRVAELERGRERFLVRPTVPEPARLAIVAFVEDPGTGEILQAAQAPVRPKTP